MSGQTCNMFNYLCFLTFCVFLVAGDSPPPSSHELTHNLKCNRQDEILACIKRCPPERTCKNRLIQYRCQEMDYECTPSCVCETGFYRNSIGECITKKQCDMCNGPNEYYSCGSACDDVCSDLQTQNKTNCPIVNIVCNKKCYCEDGYARNGKNICVPIQECEAWNVRVRRTPSRAIICQANEVLTPSKSCPPDTCFSLVAKFKCDSKEPLVPRCRCRDGYLRAKDGAVCMPMKQCPQLANAFN